MERIAHRDLRNRSAEILREVAAGASYEITNHGEVVALLIPPDTEEPLIVQKAKIRGRFGEIRSVRRPTSTQETLDYLRGDR